MSLRAGLTVTVAIVSLSAWSAPRALAADPQLRIPGFEHLEKLATDCVNITIGPGLLGVASWALGHSGDTEDRQLQELLPGLKTISIRSFKFASDHQYDSSDVDAVRSQLSGPGWTALAKVRESGDQADNVDVYVSTEHELVNGLAIIASGPREFTIVNIVGSVDPAKLAKVSMRLGLPPLPM